ncbi:MAG TPA: PAS domain S-box protein [Verrucomicrobiae bacterium]|nr:PAS domain S-box protein [Verrucomicrobiae bacterium]
MEDTCIGSNGAIALEQALGLDRSLGAPGSDQDAPFFALAEALPAISFIHQDGRFRYVSRFGEQVLGYSQEQLLQMDYWELAHPDFRELIRSRGLARQAGEELPARYEFKIITGRGETLWLECVARRTEYCGRPAVLGAAFDVTARREAQEALRLAEGKYRSIFENVAEGIFQITPEGRVLQVNPALVQMLGYQSAEELIAAINDVTRQVIVLPKDRRLMRRLMEAGGSVREFETQVRRKDGSRIWVRVNAHVVRDQDGHVLYYEGTNTDITERRKAEKQQRALAEFGHRLSAATTTQEAGRIIAQTADDLLGWDACYLHLYSPGDEIFPILTIDTVSGRRTEVPLATFTSDPSPMMQRVAAGEAQLILRPSGLGCPEDLVPFGDKGRRSASLMFVPVHSGGRVVGVFSAQSYTAQAYTRDDLRTLQSLADHCGGALERIRFAEQLRQREANHRALLDAMPDWIFRIRSDGTLLDSKVNATDNRALPAPGARGRNLAEIWPAPLVELTMNHVHSALHSRSSQQFEFQHPDGEQSRDYEARIVASGPDEVLVIIRDFSEQTRLEQEVLTISGREQERIGKDLHDDVGQLLTGLGFLAQALQQKLNGRGLAEAADAAQLNQLAARALTHTRVLARGLFPVELASKGLFVALQELALNIQTLFKVRCSVRWNSPLQIPDNTVAEHLYRLVQEAISNAIKHGRASRISIQFRAGRGQPTLTVRDNGSGVSPLLEHLGGMGTRIMDYRARRIGATLAITAAPRGGTVVTCRLPPATLSSQRRSKP